MNERDIVFYLAAIIGKLFSEGQTKINRTPLGGLLERDFPKYGVGINLTKWLEAACAIRGDAKVVPQGNRIFVVKV